MAKRSASEIVQLAAWLERNADLVGLRDESLERDRQITMRHVISSALPESARRGMGPIETPSGKPGDFVQGLVNQRSSYVTKVEVVVYDDKHRHKGDRLEKFLAIVLGQMDEEGGMYGARTYRQVGTGYIVHNVVCERTPEGHRFKVETPDIYSVAFPNEDMKPHRPSMVAQRYTMLVRDAAKHFSELAKYQAGSEHFQKRLRRVGGEKGKPLMDWLPVSREVAVNGAGHQPDDSGGFEDEVERVELVRLDDGDCVYVVCLNKGGPMDARIVYEKPHLGKGTNSVVLAGEVLPITEMARAVRPVGHGFLQASRMVDIIRTTRMYAHYGKQAVVHIARDPKFLADAAGAGLAVREAMADERAIEGAEATFVYHDGVPYVFDPPPDQDLARLEESWTNEMISIEQAHLSTLSADVLESSTLGAIQLALGNRLTRQTQFLKHSDLADKLILQMVVEHCTAYHDGEYAVHGRGGSVGTRMGDVKAGEVAHLVAEDFLVDGRTDWFDIKVTTASLSREERRLALEAAQVANASGVVSFLQMLESYGFDDITAQVKELAKDEVRRAVASTHASMLLPTWQERIRLRGGIILPGGPPVAAPVNVSQTTNAPQPPPEVAGVTGGSAQQVTAG